MREIEKAIEIIHQLTDGLNENGYVKRANDLAIQALQEKQEREKVQAGCKHCVGKNYRDREPIPLCNSHDSAEILIDTDNALYISNEDIDLSINTAEISYCPMCGRKLTKHIGKVTNMVEGE